MGDGTQEMAQGIPPEERLGDGTQDLPQMKSRHKSVIVAASRRYTEQPNFHSLMRHTRSLKSDDNFRPAAALPPLSPRRYPIMQAVQARVHYTRLGGSRGRRPTPRVQQTTSYFGKKILPHKFLSRLLPLVQSSYSVVSTICVVPFARVFICRDVYHCTFVVSLFGLTKMFVFQVASLVGGSSSSFTSRGCLTIIAHPNFSLFFFLSFFLPPICGKNCTTCSLLVECVKKIPRGTPPRGIKIIQRYFMQTVQSGIPPWRVQRRFVI